MGDAELMRIADGWMNRFEDGLEISRVELDEVYTAMLPRLTDLDPFQYVADQYVQQVIEGDYEEGVVGAIETTEATYAEVPASAPYTPDLAKVPNYIAPPAKKADALELYLTVPNVNVHVNDLLEFDITANHRCELQVFYVEETETIEVLPQEVLGPKFLEAGERRRIPYPGSGLRLRFDTPGKGETMVAFCREGGLGEARIDGEYALNYAKEHYQPLSRGLVIERFKEVEKDLGGSAVHAVTFQVSK